MSERKVLTKYYPPEFDPSKITRTPKHLRGAPKLMTVRLMAPFSMKCTSCGEYIYHGRKFNARKETTDEKYLNLPVFRFYIRCTRCSSEITFKTDPKNMDYTCERGAKRNFEAWRDPTSKELQETDEERLDRLEREEVEAAEQEEKNAMEELEQRMEESKREMRVADALDEIRMRNARIERGERGGKEEAALTQVKDSVLDDRLRQEKEDEEAARLAFEHNNVEKVRLEELEQMNGSRKNESSTEQMPASGHTFERAKRVRKPLVPDRSEAPATATAPATVTTTSTSSNDTSTRSTAPATTLTMALAAYGSDDDDD